MINDYKDLVVWQKAMKLVEEIYRLVSFLPKEEMYGLSDQMRRAVVSIPSNIAEGYDRNSDKELANFLHIARGSCAELETQILICIKIGCFQEEQTEAVFSLLLEVRKMLNAFIKKTTE